MSNDVMSNDRMSNDRMSKNLNVERLCVEFYMYDCMSNYICMTECRKLKNATVCRKLEQRPSMIISSMTCLTLNRLQSQIGGRKNIFVMKRYEQWYKTTVSYFMAHVY